MVYIALIIWINISAIVCFGDKLKFNKNTKQFLILTFIFMTIIMGLRSSNVGVDTKRYEQYFYIINNIKFSQIFLSYYTQSMEIGFVLLMKICSLIIPNYYFFQIIYSVVICYLFSKFILNQSSNVYVSTIVFLGIGIYAMSFNIARQMLAVAFIADSCIYLMKGKKIKAILLALIACTMHITALIFIVAHIIYMFRNDKKILKIILAIAVLVAINYRKLIIILSANFSHFKNYYVNERVIQSAGLIQIVWVIIIVISFYILFKSREIDSVDNLAAIFSLLYVICNVIGHYFNYFERIGLYFIPFVPILFSVFGKYIKNRIVRGVFYCSMIVCFIIYFLISVFTSEQYIYSMFF